MELIASGRADVDYIKAGVYGGYADKLDAMRSVRPVLLHGMGYFERTGMKNIRDVDFERVNALLRDYGSPHFGLHLAITNSDMAYRMDDEKIHRLMSERVRIFSKNVRVPLLLENVPDTPEDRTVFDHRPYAEAKKISRLIAENGVFFLLDLSHAVITAEYRGWDIYEYLRGTPLDRVKEIHVNGSGRDGNGDPSDPHAAMTDADYGLLSWALGHTRPDIITLEYNGIAGENGDEITENIFAQLNELKKIIN